MTPSLIQQGFFATPLLFHQAKTINLGDWQKYTQNSETRVLKDYLSLHYHSRSCYTVVGPPVWEGPALTLEFLSGLHIVVARVDNDP